MPTSSTDTFLPKNSLLQKTGSVLNGYEKTSGWKNAYGTTTVVGYFVADNSGSAANAELTVEQSIDGQEADITETVSPTAAGNAQPFEIDLIPEKVKVTVTANEDIDKLRLTVYRSTRTNSL